MDPRAEALIGDVLDTWTGVCARVCVCVCCCARVGAYDCKGVKRYPLSYCSSCHIRDKAKAHGTRLTQVGKHKITKCL